MEMWIREFIKTGLVFFLTGFICFGLSTFSSANDSSLNSKPSNFVVKDNILAQTSEITIRLEKNIPRSQNGLQDLSGDSQSPAKGLGIVKPTQDAQTYEDLEDPFAGDSVDLPIMTDPLEGYNRWMFGVNETIYDTVLEPVARGYRNVVHEDLRIGVKNFFSNAMAPVKFVSSLIQLDFEKSGRVLARALINTTFGIGGLADVADEEYDINSVNEDFDQALGHYGIPTGPYVVLPIFGPSTARNILGRGADGFLSPTFFLTPGTAVSLGISVEENINSASFIVDDKKQLEDSALDEYESVRDFYHQYRHGLVKN